MMCTFLIRPNFEDIRKLDFYYCTIFSRKINNVSTGRKITDLFLVKDGKNIYKTALTVC